MENKQRFYIYDRKEMGVLVLLGVMVALFAFTLGVHLGKRVLPKPAAANTQSSQNPENTESATEPVPSDATVAPTVADQIPTRQELTEQSKNVPQAVDEHLNQELHDEVARTGIKLDKSKQIELPKSARNKNAGATQIEKEVRDLGQKESREKESVEKSTRSVHSTPSGEFTLQVGSFQTMQEARDAADAFEALGMKPYLKSVDLKKKGKWYRIYVGSYSTHDAADLAGASYKARNMIETFVVSKATPEENNKGSE